MHKLLERGKRNRQHVYYLELFYLVGLHFVMP